MKRIIAMLTMAASFAACGGGDNNANTTLVDSVKRAGDSIKQTGDTSALNKPVGDTASAGGTPQKKSDSAK